MWINAWNYILELASTHQKNVPLKARNSSVKKPSASPLDHTSWHPSNWASRLPISFFSCSIDLGEQNRQTGELWQFHCQWVHFRFWILGCKTVILGKILSSTIIISILVLKLFDQGSQLPGFLHQAVHELLEAIFRLAQGCGNIIGISFGS